MLDRQLRTLANKIQDRSLRKSTLALLESPTFEVNGEIFRGMSFGDAPAGRSHHHSYQGGYLEHVVSASKIALAMCDSVENVYHGKVKRDFVIAGMLLHDAFKPITYSLNTNGSYSSTAVADYLDHLSIATAELIRRNFPLELVHIVAAHHGDYGPLRPRSVEALICHLADFIDSRLNGGVLSAASYLARRAGGQEFREMTSKEAFEIVHSKAVEGWEGVTRTVEKLEHRRHARKP